MQQGQWRYRCPGILWAILVVWAGLFGCSDSKGPVSPDVLIQINDSVVTVEAFDRAVEETTADFPTDMAIDAEILADIQLRILNQLTERLILLERARELNIQVDDAELDGVIASIKSDYPKGEFDQVLIEQAVSYNKWKNDLRIRLLMEKVIDHELNPRIHITPEEISDYYEAHYKTLESDADKETDVSNIEAIIVQQVRNSKKEAMYRDWMKALEKQYTLNVNQAAWDRMMTRP
ncbi:MAG: SurA N-terminal domain-containing protein [Desulfobacterales bacterium]|nr:SurA N-terminal domain-containing protein [Desulfobacterales bacterium]MDX2512535.1 SurA N-terminal domain-containing protein [Desulfobacterales bacterium]